MNEKFEAIINSLPFVGLVTGNATSNPMFTRLIETAVMSAVAGSFAVYIGVKILETEVDHIKTRIERIDRKVERIEDKVDKVQIEVYRSGNGSR